MPTLQKGAASMASGGFDEKEHNFERNPPALRATPFAKVGYRSLRSLIWKTRPSRLSH